MCSEDAQKKAMDSFHAAASKEDVLDSDLEELVSCLDDEDANELDLKELKEKKRKKRYQTKSAASQQHVPDRSKPARRGRGRGRGKGAGKGRGRGIRKTIGKRLAKDRPAEPAGAPPATEPADAGNEYSPSPGFSEGVPDNTFADIAPEDPASLPNAASALAEASLPPADENMHVAEQGEQAPSEPASSSGANPPLQDPPSSGADPPLQHPPSSKQVPHTKGVPRPKVYSTPVEVLSAMLPPGCKILLNHNEHRFTTTWVGTTDGVPLDLKGIFFQDLL